MTANEKLEAIKQLIFPDEEVVEMIDGEGICISSDTKTLSIGWKEIYEPIEYWENKKKELWK